MKKREVPVRGNPGIWIIQIYDEVSKSWLNHKDKKYKARKSIKGKKYSRCFR